MRSSRALRLLLISARNPHAASRTKRQVQQSIRNGYCTACEPPAPVTDGTAESTTNTPKSLADHRQLGIEQELFTTSIYSPGSPMFLPNGTRIFNRLTNFVRSKYDLFGFQEVITPTIYKRSLWEKSGHWDHYADDMYAVTGRGAKGGTENKQAGEDEEYGLKPMNCPGHCLIFASKQRSYRDLPIRYADFSPLHRNEIHGALSGLTRVRRFHQDDGHIFCRPSQIEEEISSTLGFIELAYKALKLGPYRLALSTRPADHFIGTIEEWENAEAALIKSLDASGQEWTLNKGDGAFYGPKIDVILKDSDGKEHQTATVQLDFQLPKRFELEYQAPAAELEQKGLTTEDPELLAVQGPVRPVLIHRAVLGSVERIMALLIEHHNGHWPFWLNPRQVMIITVNDSPPVVEFAQNCRNALTNTLDEDGTREDTLNRGAAFGLSADIDSSARSIGKKIREAKQKRYSVIAVIGEKDISEKSLVVDLTGIPGAEGGMPQNRLLRILAAEKKGILDHEAISQVSKVPALNPGDLKSLRMPLSALRAALNSIQTQYL